MNEHVVTLRLEIHDEVTGELSNVCVASVELAPGKMVRVEAHFKTKPTPADREAAKVALLHTLASQYDIRVRPGTDVLETEDPSAVARFLKAGDN